METLAVYVFYIALFGVIVGTLAYVGDLWERRQNHSFETHVQSALNLFN